MNNVAFAPANISKTLISLTLTSEDVRSGAFVTRLVRRLGSPRSVGPADWDPEAGACGDTAP